MIFDPGLIRAALPEIASGMAITLAMWLAGSVMGLVLGMLVAIARRFGPSPLAIALTGYVGLIRGTPFLVQLFLLYYGGPYAGIDLDPVQAGLLGLSVYSAAYFAEIFRGGFEAIPPGHVEAAVCVGLTRAQIIRRILLPEMTLLVLPSVVNLFILLVKETAILSIVTVPELTMVITAIGSANFAFAEATFLLAVCYWAIVEATSWLGRVVERRLGRFRLAT
jgi:polar amino acid transport system permease protein